ncbi:MAG: cytidine deaminase [Alistipes sp.]|nr:cytidine deaminase [Alistipes sp.]
MKSTINIPYERYKNPKEMSSADAELIAQARQATQHSYAPFSGFKVGAAARLKSGRIIIGANRESEVYPSGLCAERVLLFSHQANCADDAIEAIAIASDPAPRECYPCGACRQTLIDVERRQGQPLRIIMAGKESATVVESAELLLPFTFKL